MSSLISIIIVIGIYFYIIKNKKTIKIINKEKENFKTNIVLISYSFLSIIFASILKDILGYFIQVCSCVIFVVSTLEIIIYFKNKTNNKILIIINIIVLLIKSIYLIFFPYFYSSDNGGVAFYYLFILIPAGIVNVAFSIAKIYKILTKDGGNSDEM